MMTVVMWSVLSNFLEILPVAVTSQQMVWYVIGRPTMINPALVLRINDMLYGG